MTNKVRDTNSKNFSNINDCENEDDDDVIDKDEANDVLESGEASDLLNKIDDELEYVGENEEQKQLNQNEASSDDDEDNDSSDGLYDGSDDELNGIKLAKKQLQEEKSQLKNIQKKSRDIDPQRVAKVINISEMIDDYKYDAKKLQSFEITFKVKDKTLKAIFCHDILFYIHY